MTIFSTNELKSQYLNSRLADVEAYTKAAREYLSDAIKRSNVSVSNQIVVSMFSDKRISGTQLFSAEDTTSPYLSIDYGLLKNSKYSTPSDLRQGVVEKLEAVIMSLPALGYIVEPFWGYTRGFGLVAGDIVEESFTPVKCFRIRWSNL